MQAPPISDIRAAASPKVGLFAIAGPEKSRAVGQAILRSTQSGQRAGPRSADASTATGTNTGTAKRRRPRTCSDPRANGPRRFTNFGSQWWLRHWSPWRYERIPRVQGLIDHWNRKLDLPKQFARIGRPPDRLANLLSRHG
jgi:hypothetical protein